MRHERTTHTFFVGQKMNGGVKKWKSVCARRSNNIAQTLAQKNVDLPGQLCRLIGSDPLELDEKQQP